MEIARKAKEKNPGHKRNSCDFMKIKIWKLFTGF